MKIPKTAANPVEPAVQTAGGAVTLGYRWWRQALFARYDADPHTHATNHAAGHAEIFAVRQNWPD